MFSFFTLFLAAFLVMIAVLFNVFRLIVTLTEGYNRPANITSPILATFIAILPALAWLIVSLSILFLILSAMYTAV